MTTVTTILTTVTTFWEAVLVVCRMLQRPKAAVEVDFTVLREAENLVMSAMLEQEETLHS